MTTLPDDDASVGLPQYSEVAATAQQPQISHMSFQTDNFLVNPSQTGPVPMATTSLQSTADMIGLTMNLDNSSGLPFAGAEVSASQATETFGDSAQGLFTNLTTTDDNSGNLLDFLGDQLQGNQSDSFHLSLTDSGGLLGIPSRDLIGNDEQNQAPDFNDPQTWC